MASGTERTPKPRRPTAFEVSFPNEDDDDREEYEGAPADEGYDVRMRQGKRKHDSTTGSAGRVSFFLFSPRPPFWMPLTPGGKV
jgi:hypothetical protein